MYITFIYPEISSEINSRGSFHFGIGSLSASLKEAGHKTSLIHLTQVIEKNDFLSLLNQKNPNGLIAFSSTTNDFPFVKRLARWAKEKYRLPIICGGVHPTIDPETSISCCDIDMICVGEGEAALVELCNNMDKGQEIDQIRSLWVKKDGKIIRNPVRPLLEDLDSLPYADREIFNYGNLEEMGEKRLAIMASRGCPYNCSYCCNHLIKGQYSKNERYVRFRGVENVIGEIKKGLNDYPSIERIVFHDDILPLNRRWFEEFLALYKARIGLPFICNSRVNLMDKDIVQKLKNAGCIQVGMGIESGNDSIRTTVLNRKITREQIISAFNDCKNAGLRTYAFNMVGLPLDNKEAVLETIKLNVQVRPSKIQTSIFYPYPFTKLYNLCIEKGYLDEGKVVNNYFTDTILKLDGMSREEVVFFNAYFTILVGIYQAISLFPHSIQKNLEHFLDGLLCSPLIPRKLLITIKRRFAPRTLLRGRFPTLYFYIRPWFKKLQYKRK